MFEIVIVEGPQCCDRIDDTAKTEYSTRDNGAFEQISFISVSNAYIVALVKSATFKLPF